MNPYAKAYVPLVMGMLIALATSSASATTYRIGPGRTYTQLQQVVDLLNPGDAVEVDGDASYPGHVQFTKPGTAASPMTVRGVRINGHRPVLSGKTNTVRFVSPWPYTTGAESPLQNAASSNPPSDILSLHSCSHQRGTRPRAHPSSLAALPIGRTPVLSTLVPTSVAG